MAKLPNYVNFENRIVKIKFTNLDYNDINYHNINKIFSYFCLIKRINYKISVERRQFFRDNSFVLEELNMPYDVINYIKSFCGSYISVTYKDYPFYYDINFVTLSKEFILIKVNDNEFELCKRNLIFFSTDSKYFYKRLNIKLTLNDINYLEILFIYLKEICKLIIKINFFIFIFFYRYSIKFDINLLFFYYSIIIIGLIDQIMEIN